MKLNNLLNEAFAGPLIALDLDDTLIATLKHWHINDLIKNEGLEPSEMTWDEIKEFVNNKCVEYLGIKPIYHEISEGKAVWSFPRPHLHSFLDKCKSLGKTIILTSASDEWAKENIEAWDMDIDESYSSDDMHDAIYQCASCGYEHYARQQDEECQKCGKPLIGTANAVLVDDMLPAFLKERFLGIHEPRTGTYRSAISKEIKIKPYRYSSFAEFSDDNELNRIFPLIKAKLHSPVSAEDIFAAKIDNALFESVLDWPRDRLAPDVWDKVGKTYRLKPAIRKQIMSDLSKMPAPAKQTIVLIGSICSYNYNDKSDIDVHIIPSEQIGEADYEKWLEYAKGLSGNLVGEHPLNYYLHTPGEAYHADSIYDVLRDRWVKWSPIKKIELRSYYDKFRKIIDVVDINRAELYRDIVDLEELRDAYDKTSPTVRDQIEAEIASKIEEINKDIDDYIDMYIDLKDKRHEALSKFPDERTRSSLPANVVFLLIRRYGYGVLANALKDLRKEKEKISSPSDMDKIKKAFYI